VTDIFFRFPHTPHLAWLGDGVPRDDKVLSDAEAEALLGARVVVEEKLDGANLGLSLAPDGTLRAQNRGQYLVMPYTGQFSRLNAWLAQHGAMLIEGLERNLILFGEWCAARHTVAYTGLADWFLLFDVYDCVERRFWSARRRDELAARLGLCVVAHLFAGRTSLANLQKLLATTPSAFGSDVLEGVVIRRDDGDWCEARAKLVRADFTQAIGEHWQRRAIEWNRQRAP